MCYSRRLRDDKVKEFQENYPAPSNIPNLQTPKTDKDVWELMESNEQALDKAIQKAQNLLVHGLSALLILINKVGHGDVDIKQKANMLLLSDGQRAMSWSISQLNQARKELCKGSLGYPLEKLCNWDHAVAASTLFTDLNAKLNEKNNTKWKLTRQSNRKYVYFYHTMN